MIDAIALLRVAIVDHGIGEVVDVAGCLPYRWVHKDGSIDTHDVVVHAGHGSPPVVADGALQFGAVLAIVVYGRESVIDFGGRENEAILLAMGDEGGQRSGSNGHRRAQKYAR